MKKTLIIIVIIAVLGGGAFALAKQNDKKDATKPAAATSKKAGSSNENTATQESQAVGTSFTVNANDDDADLKVLNVKKGDKVSVTFKIDTSKVYYGGLEFKSDVVSTGEVKPGNSETVTFTADKSFDFTPYWPASNIKKDYVIAVKVQ